MHDRDTTTRQHDTDPLHRQTWLLRALAQLADRADRWLSKDSNVIAQQHPDGYVPQDAPMGGIANFY